MGQAKTISPPRAEHFYADTLSILLKSRIPFMIGGTYALGEHADIFRPTKDLDLFCKASDYPRILEVLKKFKFKTELTDDRWIVKAFKGKYFVDFIFNSASGICPVDDTWLEHAPLVNLLGKRVKLVPVEEMIWSKTFTQDKNHYHGADVNHMILKKGKTMDWKRLLTRMEAYWEVLLSQLINYRFVYPSNREHIPRWVMEELVKRLIHQLRLPSAHDKVCRGPLLARSQYQVDISEWGYQVTS